METASCLLGRSTEAESMEAAVVAWMELMPVLVKASPRDSALLHALFKVGTRLCAMMWVKQLHSCQGCRAGGQPGSASLLCLLS